MNTLTTAESFEQTLSGAAARHPTNPATETKIDYCKRLCKVLTRYLTADELTALIKMLEVFKQDVLAKRYSPGLNDASYDLYTAFHIRRTQDVKIGAEAA